LDAGKGMTLLEKIRATVSQRELLKIGDRIVVAVSGGPDSLALLHLLLALRNEWQLQLHVAHLNHQLRGAGSDGDAEFVAQLARNWNLPITLESRDVAAFASESKLSIEEAARQLRYGFLTEAAQQVGASAIAVGHNADDQVETILMHLLRGSGSAGLRGMLYRAPTSDLQSRAPNLHIVRPLLDVTRAEIEAYCNEHSLTPRTDSSNLDTKLFRNRLRYEVLPYLESINPRFRETLTRTSRTIADEYDYLEAQAHAAFLQTTRKTDGEIIFNRETWRQLHPALQRMTLRIAIQQLRNDLRNIDWTHIEDARHIALDKGAGAVATLPDGLRLIVGYKDFVIGDEKFESLALDIPQIDVDCMPLPPGGTVGLSGSNWLVAIERFELSRSPALWKEERAGGNKWVASFDRSKIAGRVAVRPRRAGDHFQPAGMDGHSKSIHEFMIDQKIPRAARAKMPLLVDGEKILWVCGFRIDERVRLTSATRQVLQVSFIKKQNE
jgi:tRNA(Ile)-lysidine synthase